MEMENYPLVSTIITTRNEEQNIGNCLKSIKAQTYLSNLCLSRRSSATLRDNRSSNLSNHPTEQSGVEIIVADNNSTDKTREIALKYTNKVYNFGPERSAQRNFGVKQAKGKYILYLDADMILSENVIAECVEKCERGKYIALYIPERIVSLSHNESIDNFINNRCNHFYNLRNQPFLIKVRDFERSFYNATCIDAVRFVRRDKFLEI
jgi:glycosyltransferase involved in cell wall biosynthesis